MNNNDEKILSLHKQGAEVSTIIKQTGLSRSKVYRVIHNYKNNIKVAYAKQGRKIGEKRLLTPEQEQQIYNQLIHTTPDEYTFTAPKLWTRKNIRSLIGNLDIIVSDHTILNYLKRFDLLYPRYTTTDSQQNTVYISVEKLRICKSYTSTQEYRKSDSLTYIIYSYDKKGTYYFCCYCEDSFHGNTSIILNMIHDFISRIPYLKDNTSIACILPSEQDTEQLHRSWLNEGFNKQVKGKKVSFLNRRSVNEQA